MELMAKNGQHIHAGHWFALQQDSDVIAADFDAAGLFQSDRVRLVGRLVEHGGESEKFAMAGLVDDNLLVFLIDRSHLDAAG
jgi:hypothetical protein